MQGNVPVILVISRPKTDEAYWVSLKDYFSDPQVRKQRRVIFDKKNDSFDVVARERLMSIGVGADVGPYFGPDRRSEELVSNLLRIVRFAPTLYLGQGRQKHRRAIMDALYAYEENPPYDWVMRGGKVLSFHDLDEARWLGAIDPGTVESFAVAEWSDTKDSERRADFAELLKQCLGQKLWPYGIRYNADHEYFYFMPPKGSKTRQEGYDSTSKRSARTVVSAYPNEEATAFVRHYAVAVQFHRWQDVWYVELTPKYHFTEDGRKPLEHYQALLKGIRRKEWNPDLRQQLLVWADVLTRGATELELTVPRYPFLEFGELERFQLDVGLDDAVWLEKDEPTEGEGVDTEADTDGYSDLPLFTQ